MTLTVDTVAKHIRLALNGRSYLSTLELLNGAGNLFWNMHDWEFATEEQAALDLRQDQDFVVLPANVERITAWEGTDSLNDRIHFVSSRDLLQYRTQSIYFTTTHYVSQVIHRVRPPANILGRSEDLSNTATWGQAGSPIVTGGLPAPSTGTATATAVDLDDSSAGTKTPAIFEDIPRSRLVPGRRYCFSVYAEVNSNFLNIQINQGWKARGLFDFFTPGHTTPDATFDTDKATTEQTETVLSGVVPDDGVLLALGWVRVFVSAIYQPNEYLPSSTGTVRCEFNAFSNLPTYSGHVRLWGAQVNEGTKPTPYAANSSAGPLGQGRLEPRLDIWPAPQADQAGGISIRYTTRWTDLEDDFDPIPVPRFSEELFLEVCAEYALGKEQRNKGTVQERMERLKRSQVFRDAAATDAKYMPTLGTLRYGAASRARTAVYPYSLDNFVNDPS